MTIHSAAVYLVRFDQPPSAPAATAGANDDAPEIEPLAASPPPPDEPPPPPARSEEEILAEAETKFKAALVQEREAFERRLEEERARWVKEQGEALGREFARSQEQSMTALRADVARILSPFVSREIVDRVLEDLIAAMRRGLANEESPLVSVSAPRDLLERIEATLKSENIAVAAQPSERVDARVAFASTILESRLNDWIEQLSKEKGSSR